MVPTDEQIHNFITDDVSGTDPRIMFLWCKRAIQLFIDRHADVVNSSAFRRIYLGQTVPLTTGARDWLSNDVCVKRALPYDFTAKLSKRACYEVVRLVRMMYFKEFMLHNGGATVGNFKKIFDFDGMAYDYGAEKARHTRIRSSSLT